MRNNVSKVLGFAMAGAALVLIGTVSVRAETSLANVDCEAFAKASADEVAKDFMQRAGVRETAKPGKVLMIAAGQKFYVPTETIEANALAPKAAWESMYAWNKAYKRARWNCPTSYIVIDNKK